MILVGVGVFKEAFTHWQKIGLMLLLTGLAMFSTTIRRTFQLGQLRGRRDDGGFGQHDWVCYGVAQNFCPNISIRNKSCS